jgi:pyruvate/2-oxoglutarate/acetoin dehydrogenase E1 component
MLMRIISYSQAINEALGEEMEKNEKVILLGEDIGVYGGAFGVTRGLLERFGEDRVIETPISENSFVGIAVGAAMTGLIPIVEIMFMDFITLAMDQIVNHAAKFYYIYDGQFSVPLVIRTPAGAGRGYGASHSQSLESWFLSVPGIKVVAPSNPYDAKGLLKSAINDPNPVLFVENKLLYVTKGEVLEDEYTVTLGTAKIVMEGEDVTIISYSRMVSLALEAAQFLSKEGVKSEVVDLVSLKPLDIQTIAESVEKTGRAVIVEEGYKQGGIGSEISAILCEEYLGFLDGPIIRVGTADVPIPSSKYLENLVIPGLDGIIEAVRKSISW